MAQVIYTFSMQFLAQYNTLFAQALGASGSDIGLISAISALVIVAASAFVGLAIERYSVKKVMILGLICEAVAMVIFILAWEWYMLIPAFILYGQLFRQMAFADIIFITFTEPSERATVMSFSRLLCGGAAISAPLISAAIVTYSGGISAQGIRPLYYVSLVIILGLLIFLCKSLHGTKLSKGSVEKSSLINTYKELFKGEKYLRRWILIRLFRDGFTFLFATFVPLWIVDVKGATNPAVLGTLSSVAMASAMLVQVPAGRFADKFGRKKAFFLLTTFYCLGIVVLVLAPSTEYLYLAGVLGMGWLGGIGGAAYTVLMTMWWEAFPAEDRGKLYGVEGIIAASFRIPISILGGILWDQGFKAHIMLLPALTELAIVVPLLYTIPETLRRKLSPEK
ncbi:MAG: MFS transporter [Candidatus Bathyarchaeia archaeon]